MSPAARVPSPAPPPGAVDRALAALRAAGLESRSVADGPIGPLTTYRVGGAAAVRVTVAEVEDLAGVAAAVMASGLEVLVVGRGSNMLISDAGFPGIAVVIDSGETAAGFARIAIDATTVTAGAAVALPTLARQTVEAGLTGLEWAVGVPGSVGGAVRMNAGGHGSDTASSVESALVYDLHAPEAAAGPVRLTVTDLAYGYRRSSIRPSQVVVSARYVLAAGDAEIGRESLREIVRWRREHQPGGQNAGSVFTNPDGDSAGRLIDTAGLKGRRLGTAAVSAKHANFIQAEPGGSADDVYQLIQAVRAEVRSRLGVDLRPEVRLIGFEPQTSSRG